MSAVINTPIEGTFELDGRPVTFAITGTGEEDYNVHCRGYERHSKACLIVEAMQAALRQEPPATTEKRKDGTP